MKLKPKANRVILKEKVIEHKSEGGIILSSDSSIMNDVQEMLFAEVIAIGDGITINGVIQPMECKVGETVYYNPRQGVKFTFGGQELILLRDNEVAFGVEL